MPRREHQLLSMQDGRVRAVIGSLGDAPRREVYAGRSTKSGETFVEEAGVVQERDARSADAKLHDIPHKVTREIASDVYQTLKPLWQRGERIDVEVHRFDEALADRHLCNEVRVEFEGRV
jgi:hypothetical protein